MGVDYTAFVAYGDRLELENDVDFDDLNAKIPKHLRIELIPWGGRNYGLAHGHLLMLKETYSALDIGDGGSGGHLWLIPRESSMDLIDASNRLKEAHDAIGEHHRVSRGWFAGVWVS